MRCVGHRLFLSSFCLHNTDRFNNPNLKPRRVPIQLRQSGDGGDGGLNGQGARFLIDTRTRKGPYFHLAQAAGCWAYTIYNKVQFFFLVFFNTPNSNYVAANPIMGYCRRDDMVARSVRAVET